MSCVSYFFRVFDVYLGARFEGGIEVVFWGGGGEVFIVLLGRILNSDDDVGDFVNLFGVRIERYGLGGVNSVYFL